MLKHQYFGHLMRRAISCLEGKGATEDEKVGWHHWLNGHEFEQTPGDSEGQGSLACCSPWGHKESAMTEQLNDNQRVSWMKDKISTLSTCLFNILFDNVNGAVFLISFLECSLLVLLFSHSVVADSLQPHGLQHARLPCPLPTPGACSNACPLSQWCHPTISSSVVPFSSCPQSFPASRSFLMSQFFPSGGQSVGASTSASSPSNEYLGLISFRIDWFDVLAVQGTLKSLLQDHSSKASILWCSAFFMVQLTSVHDYWKNHRFDYKDLCWQSDVSAF